MIRPILTELLLFVAPFAGYAIFLWATRAGVLHPDSWPLRTVATLTAVALLFIAVSFVVLAQITGAPAGSTYSPAHMENGRLVPGQTR